ncbi:MAG: serine hydrolase [Saprospirales bacterium]|nr:MAG: serine hydrolase [Saprospirales bacterium]
MNKSSCLIKNLFLLSFFTVFSISSYELKSQLPQDLDYWIMEGMMEWKIPGMAVGVVKDNEIIYLNGFGVRKLGEPERVDRNTVFGIASVSKNMTTAALAILVDEGKLHWDDRVIDHIPWFELSDPWVSAQVTVRDLLLHRVGVGRMLGNRLQFMTSSERDEVIYQMRFMPFEAPFRYQAVYSNVMFSTAGQLIEYIEGVSWDEFLMERLFSPLQMNRTSTRITMLEGLDNVAHPHQEIDGEVVPISWRNWDNAGPAGGVNSSVADLSNWLLMQLGDAGKFQDSSLISTARMRDMHRPQQALPPGDPYKAQASFGLGWRVSDYEGYRILSHGGATDGFNTSVYMLPEENLGIIVMSNTFNLFREAVVFTLIDAIIGNEGKDWHEYYRNLYLEGFERVKSLREKINEEREKKTSPSFKLDQYTGIYADEAYGQIEVLLNENKELEIKFWEDENLITILEHWHYDTFRAIWKNPAQREEFCWFTMGKDGKPEFLKFEFALRPMLLQVGAYPSNYTRVVSFKKTSDK